MEKTQLKTRPAESELPKRVDKTLVWLANSRDKWKEKCIETKLQLKRQILAAKRARESREKWKVCCWKLQQNLIQSSRLVKTLEGHVDQLTSQLYKEEAETFKIKKK